MAAGRDVQRLILSTGSSQAETVSDLEAWYRDGANTYERRALQDLGPETIADRFRGDPSVGGLVNTLKQDRATSLETEDVQKATRAIADLEAQAYDAHSELWRHVRDLGDANAFSVDPAAATLRAVMVDRRLDDASRLDATFTHVVEKATNAGGVYWSGDVPEA